MIPAKGQLSFARFIKENCIPNIRIFFIGTGPDLNLLKEVCNETNNLFALGYLENYYDYVNDFNFFMQYSSQEGLPTVMIESCMLGKPCIANDVGGTKEIVENLFNGFIYNDLTHLSEILIGLSELNTEFYTKMCQNARNIYL